MYLEIEIFQGGKKLEKKFRILAINPGSTSTKIAVYDNTELVMQVSVNHTHADLAPFNQVADEYEYRKNAVMATLEENGIDLKTLDAISGRGGGGKPVPSGTFRVNEDMVEHSKNAKIQHASILGPMIALELSKTLNIPAFMVDPVNVDEYDDVARISGMPDRPRRSGFHALNHKATAKKAAKDMGKPYNELNMIVAHVGGGISVAAHKLGRCVDVEGTLFSPERVSPRAFDMLDMCFSGEYTKQELSKMLMGSGGIFMYFGTKDIRDIEKMIDDGNKEAELVFKAMTYNVAKAIGACIPVLHGNVDALVLTGGISHSKRFVNWIKEYCGFIGNILVYPGENELESLAMGAYRVLIGEEKAKIYPSGEEE
jgi:butyrate kinase